LKKRSVTIRGHRTSYSVEDDFQDELVRIAQARGIAIARLVAEIDGSRSRDLNLSSAIRVHVLREILARLDAPKG
jgi:predicted DNA-binding ribbon-helix-helix protein